MSQGALITFEGPDGGGKTTQMGLLVPWLQSQGYAVLATREPGGTSIGESIRDLVHDCAHTEMTSVAEILLYSASRAQLVGEVLRPAVVTGSLVLCDRYFDSTYAYQGYGRGLSLEMLRMVTGFATGGLVPDLTLFFDVPPAVGLSRRQCSGEALNRLDREALDFHRRVREGYLELVAEEPERWRVIDATASVAVVQDSVRAVLSNWLLLRRN
ncbi:MAG: dTMP kinase [Anaerolineae bacterium]|nr:dTMP kinase [Anaerolineae bacterium]